MGTTVAQEVQVRKKTVHYNIGPGSLEQKRTLHLGYFQDALLETDDLSDLVLMINLLLFRRVAEMVLYV